MPLPVFDRCHPSLFSYSMHTEAWFVVAEMPWSLAGLPKNAPSSAEHSAEEPASTYADGTHRKFAFSHWALQLFAPPGASLGYTL